MSQLVEDTKAGPQNPTGAQVEGTPGPKGPISIEQELYPN